MSIKIENLTHVYMPKSPFEKKALDNVNLVIEDGEFLALIGHTGSGKSTLIQHLNGLLEPTSGRILVDDIDITNKEAKLTEIRKKIGLVFQYPEYQLFEETIEKDIAFGPNNLGLSSEEVSRRVKKSMEMVGLDYETYKDVSPFDLSGGQKRRVAIAGVIAMEPKVLILDEPTAGLDPKGRDDILEQIKLLHEKYKMTIVLVSHSMEDVGKLAQRIVVMNKGKVELLGKPSEVFKEVETLEKIENKTASRIKQPKEFTLAPMLEKSQAKIDWESKTAEEIKNLVRGLNPIMGAYAVLNQKKIKFWKVDKLSIDEFINKYPEFKEYEYRFLEIDPGTVLYIDKKEAIYIMAKEGILKVLEIQGENAKRMPTPEFLRGNRIEVVDKFE